MDTVEVVYFILDITLYMDFIQRTIFFSVGRNAAGFQTILHTTSKAQHETWHNE